MIDKFSSSAYKNNITAYGFQLSVARFLSKRASFKMLNFVRDKSKIPCFKRGKAKILTTGIYVIFRGLKFESDAEIGQKGAF